jgi:hypothetical protein
LSLTLLAAYEMPHAYRGQVMRLCVAAIVVTLAAASGQVLEASILHALHP